MSNSIIGRLGYSVAAAALLVAANSVAAHASCAGTSCVVETAANTVGGAQTSFRDAIAYANNNPGTVISFSGSLAGSAIDIGNTPLIVNEDVLIDWGSADLSFSGRLQKEGAGTVGFTGDVGAGVISIQDGTLSLNASTVRTTSTFGIAAQGNNAVIKADDFAAHGTNTTFSALQGGNVVLSNGAVAAEGAGAIGVYVQAQGSWAELSDVAVSAEGSNAVGLRADDSGTLVVRDSSVVTTGASAHGVVGFQLLADRPVSLDLSATEIVTRGALANGLVLINDRSPVGGGTPGTSQAVFADGSILTQGQDAAGIYVRDAPLLISDSSVTSQGGSAIRVVRGGEVTVSGGSLSSARATARIELTEVNDAAIRLRDGAVATSNDGNLLVVERIDGASGAASIVLETGARAAGSIVDLSPEAGPTSLGISSGALFTGTVQGLDTVALDGGEWALVGTQDFAELLVGNGGGTLNTLQRDVALTAALQGAGTLTVTGHGRLALLGDNSGFDGLAEVAGSTLVVNDMLGGSALIRDGGRLTGRGTFGSGATSSVTVASGGAIAPGNSIGTLTVDGDLIFQAGSIYEVEVAPGSAESDRIRVTGAAFLNGGTVVHVGMTGAYDPSATYTILTADGGVNGVFDGVASSFAFLHPTLGYSGNGVTLRLERNDVGFAQVARTRNQIATARGVESLGFGNQVFNAVVQLDDATARFAFDRLSGESHVSTTSALIEDSVQIRNAANDRIRAAFEGAGASTAPVLAYGPGGPVLAPASAGHGIAGWGTAFGSWGHIGSDGNAARLDRSTGGLIVGIDGLIADAWRIGVLAGYSRSSLHVGDRASSAASDNYHLGLYGGTQWGGLSFRTGLAYTWHDINARRSVSFTGFGNELAASYGAGTFQAFGELGYAVETGAARLEPFVNLAHVSHRTNGFAETGGAAALFAGSRTTDTTFATLGVRASTDFVVGNVAVTARGMLGWRHAFSDTTPTAVHAFAGGGAFTVAGTPIARNAAVVEAGFDFAVTPDATVGLSYQGQFGSGASEHGGRVGLKVRF